MPLTPISNDNRIDSLLYKYKWDSSGGIPLQLTYSFPVFCSTWISTYRGGEPFSPNSLTYLNSIQQQYAADALEEWENVANISFTEVKEPKTIGDIRITYSTAVADPYIAWAYTPSYSVHQENGDIWINPEVTDLSVDSNGFYALLHEVGHALGFKHPFYDSSYPDAPILSPEEDSTKYTIMSYTDYGGAGYINSSNINSDVNKLEEIEPTTPMLYDILAMQYLYGANTSYNNGDDTYVFSNTKGELKTIWDAGGIDTLDLSNQSLNMTINLNAGEFSSLGVRQIGVNLPLQSAFENIAIAYGVEIENAIGGTGDDIIINNLLSNEIDAGSGNDTVIYSENRENYKIDAVGYNLKISSINPNVIEGGDTLVGVEKIQFSDQYLLINTVIPTIPSEVDINPIESDDNHINYFLLHTTNIYTNDITFNYRTTGNGTAEAGEDYISTSGIATLKAGESSIAIGIEIIGDNIYEADETFEAEVYNFVGADIINMVAVHTIMNDDFA